MAGAVPALLGRIPLHLAAEMRAGCRAFVQLAAAVAIDRNLLVAASNDRARAGLDVVRGLARRLVIRRHQ